MKIDDLCPSEKQLRQMLAGEFAGDELEVASRHIELCEICQSKLEKITSEDSVSPLISPSTQSVSSLPLVPGYQLIRIIGRGGMGVVASARQEENRKIVAIKFLSPSPALDGSPEFSANRQLRFSREIEALSLLHHPHIVRIIDAPVSGRDSAIVMELLNGGSLASWQRSLRPVSDVVTILIKVARAVQYAHDAGVIHRDLKPSNIIFDSMGEPKVTDFGLARIMQPDADPITMSSETLGTPSYTAPEQILEPRHAKPSVDVYSLGAVLYALLTGRPPHVGDSPLSTVRRVLDDAPIPPREFSPSIPQGLEYICLKCLEKTPRSRYPSCKELADDLELFRDGKRVSARKPKRKTVARINKGFGKAWSFIFALFIVVVLGSAAFIWNSQTRIHTKYFAQFELINNHYVGLFPLSASKAAQRSQSYRFLMRGNQIQSIESVNGRGERVAGAISEDIGTVGKTQENSDARECRIEFSYNSLGELTRETAYNSRDTIMWVFHHDTNSSGHYADESGFVTPANGSKASYVKYSTNDAGRRTSVMFVDALGSPVTNQNGVHRITTEYAAEGLEVANSAWGINGEPEMFPCRAHRIVEHYDEVGNRVETRFFDKKLKPSTSDAFVHCWKYEFDASGNVIKGLCFDIDDSACLSNELCHLWTSEYDRFGRRTITRYFDIQGIACRCNAGVYRFEWSSSDKGDIVCTTMMNERDTHCVDFAGRSKLVNEYNEYGEKVSESIFGIDDDRIADRDGIHRWSFEYTPFGFERQHRYFGLEGQPIRGDENVHLVRVTYDEKKYRITTEYFDEFDKPCMSTRNHSKDRGKFDEKGFLISVRYFDVDDKPCNSEREEHEWRATHDERGNENSRASFDALGQACNNIEEYHRVECQYDERGRAIMRTYWDVGNTNNYHAEGYHCEKHTFDLRDRIIETRYFDERIQPINCKSGYHCKSMQYSSRDLITESQLWGADGEPVNCDDGWHQTRFQYGPDDQVIDREYLDAEGNIFSPKVEQR